MAEYDLDLTEDEEERPFNKQHFTRILGYASPYRKTVTLSAALTLVGIAIGLVEPLLLGYAIDRGVKVGDKTQLFYVLGFMLALRLIQYASEKVQIRSVNYLGQKILYDLRQELFSHVQSLPFTFFDHRPAGKIISRLTNDVNHIGNLAASGVVNALSQFVSLVGIVTIMLFLHVKMALLTFVTIPFLAIMLTKFRWGMENAWGDTRKAVGEINAHLNETVQGLQVIQAYRREEANSGKFAKGNKKYFGSYMKAISLEQIFWQATDVIGAIGMAIVVLYGAKEYARGALTLGLIIAFVSYLQKFWQPISTFSRVWSQVLSAMASAERVFSILDLEKETTPSDTTVYPENLQGEVVFDNVSFEYKPGEPVLQQVSLRVKPGETVALVGPTGAGKTTIVNLLARFYRPTQGRILIDGHELKELDLNLYRSQLGMVLQDTFIFSGTIMDNLKFAKLDATPEEIEQAAIAAYAKPFIDSLPDRYDTELKERGSNLSTGQRQLLAFSRALLANPKILILDEATSSIDPKTERLIQLAIKKLLQGRTCFIIAHRLSTIRSADRILVIEDGRITEEGSHEQLVKAGGTYAKLYEAQFKTA